jgi:hypothetical protein
MDELYEGIARNIATSRRSVMHVMSDGHSPPFAYSIGNSVWKAGALPEVLIIGINPRVSQVIINEVSDRLIVQGVPQDRQLFMLDGGKVPLMLVFCKPLVKDVYTLQAGRYLKREDYDVMQIVVPDENGLFPWQPGCSEIYKNIPFLGETVQ